MGTKRATIHASESTSNGRTLENQLAQLREVVAKAVKAAAPAAA